LYAAETTFLRRWPIEALFPADATTAAAVHAAWR